MSIRIAVPRGVVQRAPEVFARATENGLVCVEVPPGGEDALAGFIREHNIRHAILSGERFGGPLYEAMEPGAVLARFGVGYDGLDLAQATARGLYCTITPGTLHVSVAEHAMSLLLAGARQLTHLNAQTQAGHWRGILATEVRGKTLAIIGCGAIGSTLAGIASRGFGMRVLGVEVRDVDVAAYCHEHGYSDLVRGWEDAVPTADFISLHVPATPATRGMVNAERIAQMLPTAWLVNTARGAVVDEVALYDALSEGRMAGAALDVFAHEPYRPAHPDKDLRTLPNVIMTPHVASATREACARMAARALQNILLAERGAYGEMDLVNPEVLAR